MTLLRVMEDLVKRESLDSLAMARSALSSLLEGIFDVVENIF